MDRIEQLRDSIKQKLENSEFEGRIKIDKDILEQLLFNSYDVEEYASPRNHQESTSRSVRIPVWSGKFLQKIDLSEVNFSDVFWGYDHNFSDHGIWKKTPEFKGHNCKDGHYDYSNTNANIDFRKSFVVKEWYYEDDELKERNQIIIEGCNFENVDLSKNNFDGMDFCLIDSNLKNANITIKFDNDHKNYISFCNMDGNDLSNLTVDLLLMMDGCLYGDLIPEFECNSCMNTGLKIVCNEKSLNEWYKKLFDTDGETDYFWETYRKFFDDHSFVGCYFNGTLIESKEQLIELSTNKIKELVDDYKKNITEYKMNQLLKSVDEQIESKKKKDLNDMIDDKVAEMMAELESKTPEMLQSDLEDYLKSK